MPRARSVELHLESSSPKERIGVRTELVLLTGLAVLLFAAGIRFGLPSRERSDLVFGDLENVRRLTPAMAKAWNALYINGRDPLLNTKEAYRDFRGLTDTPELLDSQPPWLLNYTRSYLVRSIEADEAYVFTALARMHPRQLDFDPKGYIYGGAYTFTVGAFLGLGWALGQIPLWNSLDEYLTRPDEMARLYVAGRLASVIAAIGVVLCAFWAALVLYDRKTARIAALLAAVGSPSLVHHAHLAKAHACAVFWASASFVGAAILIRKGTGRAAAAAGACAGLAAGCAIPNGIAIVPIVLALIDISRKSDLKTAVRLGAIAAIGFALAFFATNFFVLQSWRPYLDTIAYNHREQGYASMLDAFLGFVSPWFREGYTWPLSLAAAAFLVKAWSSRDPGDWTLCRAILTVWLVLGAVTGKPRFAMLLVPLLSIAVARLPSLFEKGTFGSRWSRVAVAVAGVYSAGLIVLYDLSFVVDDPLLRAGRFGVATLQPGCSLAIRGDVPTTFWVPPLPFSRYRLCRGPRPKGNSWEGTLPDWIISGGDPLPEQIRRHYEEVARFEAPHPFCMPGCDLNMGSSTVKVVFLRRRSSAPGVKSVGPATQERVRPSPRQAPQNKVRESAFVHGHWLQKNSAAPTRAP